MPCFNSKNLVELSRKSSSTAKGTPDWMSPEVLSALNEGKNHKSDKFDDIFSFGITFI